MLCAMPTKLPSGKPWYLLSSVLRIPSVYDQVIVCARALLAIGIEKGDRVAVLCTSRPEYWVTFLATTSIGAIWLGLNPKYQPQEIRYVIEDAQPRLLFAMAGFEGRSLYRDGEFAAG